MLERIKSIVAGGQKTETFEPSSGIKTKNPKHIAITIDGVLPAMKDDDSLPKVSEVLKMIIDLQQKKKIPILSIYLLGKHEKNSDRYDQLLDLISDFLMQLSMQELIIQEKVKVSVIGKWYDLPGRIVDAIKFIIDKTKDNTEYYLNFCINYDGQEEIADACKLLVRQVMASRIDISQITCQRIKENTYSSYFVPPDIIIKNGHRKCTNGLLLWDSQFSCIYFSGRNLLDFTKSDFEKAIEYWRKD